MAVITPTIDQAQGDKRIVVEWANVTEADTCAAYDFKDHAADISVEADDTAAWGTSTLTMLGNNGNGTGVACTSTDGTTASWTSNALFSLLERPLSILPSFTGGTAQSVTVRMVVWTGRKPNV